MHIGLQFAKMKGVGLKKYANRVSKGLLPGIACLNRGESTHRMRLPRTPRSVAACIVGGGGCGRGASAAMRGSRGGAASVPHQLPRVRPPRRAAPFDVTAAACHHHKKPLQEPRGHLTFLFNIQTYDECSFGVYLSSVAH